MADGWTIVVGGGAIGLSVAYHLGRAGVGDVLLLERNRLGSGTSWHAAGIVGPLRATRNLTELARYGVGLFRRLEDETGQATGYRRTGGYWLAQTDARLVELKRLAGLGQMHDLDARVVAPRAVEEHFPHLDAGELRGALWVAEDGQVNPVDLCMAYARGARNHGVEIREQAGVTGMTRRGGRVASVRLSTGEEIPARAVINCAGLWARELAALVDVDVPLRAVEHMYIVTEPVDGLPHPCPVVRDLDSGIYLKGDAGKLVLGMFERNARTWDPASVDAGADFLEFPEDWDH
ncbi:MAG: FAD-dependent oxidoreductase, partial [Gammaproteobacteria bacterium]|nr:FAD-dependent oxidoreductase [Gammaproteobacteria bacterium]